MNKEEKEFQHPSFGMLGFSRVNGKKVEQAKNIENRKTVSARFFNDKISKFAASINKNMTTAEKLIAKKNLSKKDQEELRMMLYGIQTELTSNIPFFRQMFQEEMDKIVVDAKAEIDAAMQHAATKLELKRWDYNSIQATKQ